MAVLFRDQTKSALEALLFVASEPLTVQALARIVEIDVADALELLLELAKEYQDRPGGLKIVQVSDTWQICTRPECAPYIERLYRKSGTGLSKAAIETLAIIAYRQPITRSEVEMIRGVKVDSPINTLLERNLIEEKGRREGPGRPVLYGTTLEFLKHFGLKDVSELPPLEEFLVEGETIDI
ncbi:condensin subunit ScpB [Desulforamulus reducens MI-1]|uniref:Segregation and condensation protein B n=1 Tax=Desulforamulus reducens (strain ATCC BAA-1160 / DSM 100696 / MI-1) TaxID=349161 RepID=SCPB_DESRM|nr:SMC-Scp complex subunit ScpB [Desulforamulus reducens]A4J3L6.1 RecName: Full=Segregation and condensation protein B [Desulforamulus reducens MI-1]ABO49669.1 condensin subunit ScpB [Desulforamulus reducens MI-1]